MDRPARTFGVDTGGTFTDVVLLDAGELRVAKLPSTPADPGAAALAGIAALGGARPGDSVVHGTTVALNALLTGATARAALVTGAGFADLLAIGRQDRPDIYALHPVLPTPLVPARLCFEVNERTWPDPATGAPLQVARPTPAELERLARRLARSGAESIAICLLHSYADPEPERRLAEALAALGLPISLSAELLPEHREVERFSTCAVNAALVPLMRSYLGELERQLGGAKLSILQSSGGTLSAQRAAVEPVRVLLSGPAGGVVGAARAAREAGYERLVSFDMGGTSTDVAFAQADGAATAGRASEPVRFAGHAVAVPSLDVHTIGCGGGSRVRIDAGGALQVGPESAGADPGPVCYGKSDVPTVTDAHVLLGHVAPGRFLGGELALDVDAVRRAFERLGEALGETPERTAQGVLEVARAEMRRAALVMTMQRGVDPRSLPLVAFGGAGGLHAAALAASLGMPAALLPRHPGLLSALGMTVAGALAELSFSPLEPLSNWSARRRAAGLCELGERARERLAGEGHRKREVVLHASFDLRYAGQSFELNLPSRPGHQDLVEEFHAAHGSLYGYRLEDRPIELVCLRMRAEVPAPHASPATGRRRPAPASAFRGERRTWFGRDARPRRARLVDRARLAPGHVFEGPALVEEYSGTALVPPRWSARVTAGGHLELSPPATDRPR